MTRVLHKRICNCYPSDSRPLNIRIREMLFKGVPLGENPDVKHDFTDSSDQVDNFKVDIESDIHYDVFDKMEHQQRLSHLNAQRAIESEPAPPSEPVSPSEPSSTE